MRILVVGSGGREHALAWKLAQEADVHATPGNPGIAEDCTVHHVASADYPGLIALAKKMKADVVIDPTKEDAKQIIFDATNGVGADVVLEMSGKTPGIRTGFDVLRVGGRMSMLGTPSKPVELDLAKSIIFKGATVIGIHGRLMYKTWFQMQNLLKAGKLDLSPVITDRIPMKDFSKGMDRLKTGESSKILLYPNGIK